MFGHEDLIAMTGENLKLSTIHTFRKDNSIYQQFSQTKFVTLNYRFN